MGLLTQTTETFDTYVNSDDFDHVGVAARITYQYLGVNEAFRMTGSAPTFLVAGTLYSRNAWIVFTKSVTPITISSTGSLICYGTAISTGGDVYNAGYIQGGLGISARQGSRLGLANDGTIIANVAVSGASSAAAVRNTGTIIGNVFLNDGNDLVQNAATGSIQGIVNFGNGSGQLISAGSIDGVVRALSSAGDTASVDNFGRITGLVALSHGNDMLKNSGAILGAIDMGAGADTVINNGEIQGNLTFCRYPARRPR